MAKPAARLGDNVAHIDAAGAILNGSSNVLVNGLPAARQSDPVQHDEDVEVITQGSSSVLFNGLPASRISDGVACGGKIAAGSGNTLIGDGGAVACSTCPGGLAVGNPVNPLLGAKVLSEIDFALPGPLSVVWQRSYSSYVGPAGERVGVLGPGWSAPLDMHLLLSPTRTQFFDTKNRVITFRALAPGEQAHSVSEGIWLLRCGRYDRRVPLPLPEGVSLEDLHPAARDAYSDQCWQDDERWSHVPTRWKENSSCCLAVTADRNAWLFACLDTEPLPESQWLLIAIIDIFGRIQRFERAITPEAMNEPVGLLKKARPRPDRPSLPRGQLVAITDCLNRRYELQYTRLSLPSGLAIAGDTGLRLDTVSVKDFRGPELLRALRGNPLVQYEYSTEGDLIAVRGRRGRRDREFTYIDHRMKSHRDVDGPESRYIYEDRPEPGFSYRKVVSQLNEEGLGFTFEYQSNQTEVTDSLGRKTIYEFKGEGGKRRLSKLRDPLGAVTEYEYDLHGQIVQETDAVGRVVQYKRDARGRLAGIVLPDGRKTYSEWNDATNSLSKVVGRDGISTSLIHDCLGRLVESRIEDGTELGHVTSFRYPDPTANTHSRLTAEFPIQVVDAKGGITNLVWSQEGRLLQRTDCSGQITRFHYDIWGESTGVTNALGQSIHYHRNESGQLICTTYPDNTKTHFHYDKSGYLSQLIDASGSSIYLDCDIHGKIIRAFHGMSNGDIREMRFKYDIAQRVTSVINENGIAAKFSYDALDRCIEEVGFDGRRHCFQYDLIGQLIATVDHGGADGSGIPLSLVTSFEYDKAGRLTKKITPELVRAGRILFPVQEHNFIYDSAGRVVEARVDKTIVRFERDLLGWIREESLTHEDTNPFTANQAITRSDCFSTENCMNEQQRLAIAATATRRDAIRVKANLSKNNGIFFHSIKHRYNALGVRENTKLHHFGEIDFLTYGSGHLHQVAVNKVPMVDFERDELHRETARHLLGDFRPDNSDFMFDEVRNNKSKSCVTLQRIFDSVGRLVRTSGHSVGEILARSSGLDEQMYAAHPATHNRVVLPKIQALSREFSYDSLGRLASIRAPNASDSATSGISASFSYDNAHRLVQAEYGNGDFQSWFFDPAGNRIAELPTANSSTVHYSPNGANGSWLSKASSASAGSFGQACLDNRPKRASILVDGEQSNRSIEYDAWGNVQRISTISGPSKGRVLELIYDGIHQLRASYLTEPAKIESDGLYQQNEYNSTSTDKDIVTITFFDYDPFGRRISKAQLERNGKLSAKVWRRTWFGWDGDRVVTKETKSDDERSVVGTIYEPNSFIPLLYFRQESKKIVRNEDEDSSNVSEVEHGRKVEDLILHYHCNHLGTPEALISERGDIVWHAEFDPWGNLRSEYDPHRLNQEIRMQGQQLDTETGLYYNRNRYYEPVGGRYITQDPIGYLGGANKQAYASAPTMFTDPLGLFQVYGFKSPQTGEVKFSFDFLSQSSMDLKQTLMDTKIPGLKKLNEPLKKERQYEKSKSAGGHDSTDPVGACACDNALKKIFEENWKFKSGSPAHGDLFTREQAEKILSDFNLILREIPPPNDKNNIKGGEACRGLYNWSELLNTATQRAADVKGTFGGFFN